MKAKLALILKHLGNKYYLNWLFSLLNTNFGRLYLIYRQFLVLPVVRVDAGYDVDLEG